MSEHTPGRWFVGDQNYVMAEDPEAPSWPWMIAQVSFAVMENDDGEANARLIAAAPALLEACKLARAFGSQGETHEGISVSEIMRHAIAIAEGNRS